MIESETLAKISAIRSSISKLAVKNDDTIRDIISVTKRWRQTREMFDRQCNDIELALDVVYDVDNRMRGIIDLLSKGLMTDGESSRYVEAMEYGFIIQDKSKEVEFKGNERLEELYSQLGEALKFGVGELKRFWPVYYGKEDSNKALLRKINKLLRHEHITDHFGDVVKIFYMRLEKYVKDSIEGLQTIIDSSSAMVADLNDVIADLDVSKTIQKNVYKRLSKTIFELHFKPFLRQFPDSTLEAKKAFLTITDKCFSEAKKAEAKEETEVFLSMLDTFYSAIFDSMDGFMKGMEIGIVEKSEQAFDNAAKTLCDCLALIDSFTGTLTMVVKNRKNPSSDAIEYSVKLASQFVKILKTKSDSLKTKSQLHSHLFALKLLHILETEISKLKKVPLKLKPGIEKSSGNATKAYLYYCWAHVLAHKPGLESAKDGKELLQKYFATFQIYEKNLENVLETHKRYPYPLPESLKVKLRKDHLKLVYPKYHQLLNDFLALKNVEEKNKYFKYYANDFEKLIENDLLK